MPKNVLAKSIKKTTTATKGQLANDVKRRKEEKMDSDRGAQKFSGGSRLITEPKGYSYTPTVKPDFGYTPKKKEAVPAKMKTTTVKTVKTPEAKTVTMTKRSVATKATKKSGKLKK